MSYLGQMWKNERDGFKGMCIKFQWEKCQIPLTDPLALGTAQWGWRTRALCTVAGYGGRVRGTLGVHGWLGFGGVTWSFHQSTSSLSRLRSASWQHDRAHCSQLAGMASVCWWSWCWGGCWGVSSQRVGNVGWQLPRSHELTAVAESTSSTYQDSVSRSIERQRWGTYWIFFSHSSLPSGECPGTRDPRLASDLPEPQPHVPTTHFFKNSFNLHIIKFAHFKYPFQWFSVNLQSRTSITTTQFYNISSAPKETLWPFVVTPGSHPHLQAVAHLFSA